VAGYGLAAITSANNRPFGFPAHSDSFASLLFVSFLHFEQSVCHARFARNRLKTGGFACGELRNKAFSEAVPCDILRHIRMTFAIGLVPSCLV
jgi:hypothetical protein